MCKYSSKKDICLHIWTICIWPSNPWLRIIFAPRGKCLCKCGIYRTVIATDSKSSAISAFALAQIWAKLSKCGIWMYKMKFSCYQESLLFMASLFLGFWLRNTPLVKVGNPISDGIVFHLAWCVRGLKSLKRFWPYLIVFSASRTVTLSNYCIWCLFFISNIMKSGVVYVAI